MILILILLAFLGCRAFAVGNFKSVATGISSSFEQCRKWIQDCSESHVECQVEKTLLPHRVVDIGYVKEEVS
jgi:hypothetical protein